MIWLDRRIMGAGGKWYLKAAKEGVSERRKWLTIVCCRRVK